MYEHIEMMDFSNKILDLFDIVVLIDEGKAACAYAVCGIPKKKHFGTPRILNAGKGSIKEVAQFALNNVEKYSANVVCDAIPGRWLQQVAKYQGWQIAKPKINEFSAIGFICRMDR